MPSGSSSTESAGPEDQRPDRNNINQHSRVRAKEVHPALSIESNMDSFVIKAMVQALRPTLKDPKRAEAILNQFWRDKIALVWDTEDVHTAANEREVALTNQEAIKVLQETHHYHNKQYGLKWQDVTAYIEEYALGRKLTKAEVKRFVEKNILTIERKRR